MKHLHRVSPPQRLLTSIALALASLSACADAELEDPEEEAPSDQRFREEIANGTVVTSGPIAASTVMFVPQGGDGMHGCSASIIDASHALTAGHCLIGLLPTDRPELVFATKVGPGGTRRTVSKFVRPTNTAWDIAVLTFTGGLPAGYRPVVLAKSGFALSANVTPVIHAGYGQTTATVNDRGTLHQVTTTYRATVADRRYRATGNGGICSGDSGGPDYVVRAGRIVQTGVHVSGDCATGAISTDVRLFNSYIVSTGARPTFTL